VTVLRIATLFPLDTVAAGDDANGPALVRRARQRGIEATHTTVNRPEALGESEIYLLGGDGLSGVEDLVAHLRATRFAANVRSGGALVLAVDAGLAAVGRSWTDASGTTREGLALVGTQARWRPMRVESAMTHPAPDYGLPSMIGWHSGGFEIRRDPDVAPLARLSKPGGPAGTTYDGGLAGGVIGTQLHGPVLALNPELADLVLARALGVQGFDPAPIPAIDAVRRRRIAELASPTRPNTLPRRVLARLRRQ
jgi:hypothetical protein